MNPNDPAFPTEQHEQSQTGKTIPASPGLTKREEFAKAAMQGILASRDLQTSAMYKMDKEWTASEACAHADALCAELNKETK